MEDILKFLEQTAFCKEMPNEDIRTIIPYCHEGNFEPNQVIFYENDEADRVFLILSGQVEVWKAYGSPDADILAILDTGHLFGEMALIDRLPRSATVISKVYTRVLYIVEKDFEKILLENKSVALSMVRSLSGMVRKSNETFLADLRTRNRQLEEAYTDLKKTQNELLHRERLSNLGKISSMILHDIRNPIQVIKMYLDILGLRDDLPEATHNHLNSIRGEAERLKNIANEFLDYSRGDIRLNIRPVDFKEFMNTFKERISRQFNSKQIELHMENRYEGMAFFDEERMNRALLNLSDNARKAMGSSGRLSIVSEREANNLVFLLEDNGEGMSEVVLAHIFEPFYSSSRQGGTGLGMPIVKSIVKAHKGTLKIHSTPGKGTRIRIVLPHVE
jgi:signal transduction histidine kinase